ncbi:hypothetical protein P167DRAFT_536033 [Morchella conica CCBAS932]|uniref:Uncharacterized protein n=1 Tax=Morchella conica CCBAS932 TaxID=1392247 RepID=A0A3N4KRP1_9PEZI|nr:hypothetical protein P167DRAFT_536033 [Morchella conica CCBAS932]
MFIALALQAPSQSLVPVAAAAAAAPTHSPACLHRAAKKDEQSGSKEKIKIKIMVEVHPKKQGISLVYSEL